MASDCTTSYWQKSPRTGRRIYSTNRAYAKALRIVNAKVVAARKAFNKAALKGAKMTFGRFLRNAIPFATAGCVYFDTRDLSAAGREATLELYGADLARDMGLALGVIFDNLQDQIANTSLGGAKTGHEWIRQPGMVTDTKSLGQLTRLESLALDDTQVGHDGLIALAREADRLGNLEQLFLGATAIDDSAIEVLAQNFSFLKKLQELELTGTNVGDAYRSTCAGS